MRQRNSPYLFDVAGHQTPAIKTMDAWRTFLRPFDSTGILAGRVVVLGMRCEMLRP